MKLKKAQLVKLLRKKIEKLGYLEIKNSQLGSDGLFVKKIGDGYFLTLGLTISRFHSDSFTASFYLSKSTRFGSVWGDIPIESYKRIGHFLTKEEREEYLDEEYNQEGVVDAWWRGIDDLTISHFISAIEKTEMRFLEQPNLLKKIDASSEVREFTESVRLLLAKISSDEFEGESFKFIPKRPIDDIPLKWFKAAEKTINERGGLINENLVKLLAADAWNQFMIPFWIQAQIDI